MICPDAAALAAALRERLGREPDPADVDALLEPVQSLAELTAMLREVDTADEQPWHQGRLSRL